MKSLVLLSLTLAGAAGAQSQRSIPVKTIEYQVTFDSSTAESRIIKVGMSFTTSGQGSVLLSLPEWTPGAYEVGNFARFINEFSANGDLITFGGPPIPIAAAMDDSAIRRLIGVLPSTPLEIGISETIDRFAALRDAGRLDTGDLI